MAQTDKWRFAIGTTSRVPGQPGMHFLILDFDNMDFYEVFQKMKLFNGQWHAQSTQSGYHVYTRSTATFQWILARAYRLGADPAWLRIGEKRGYLFLADKAPVSLPWPVERMVIARGQAGRNI